MTARGPTTDHFPSTHRTWLQTRLDDGRAAALAGDADGHTASIRAIGAHVMDRYRKPLAAYVRGSRWKHFGDADDLVAGFFARRLASLEYLERWSALGVSLRRWLMNGMLLELRSLARDRRRESTNAEGFESAVRADESALIHDAQAERAFDRAWARGVLEDAAALAAHELAEEGLDATWTIFERHVLDGVDYRSAAGEVGVPPSRARAMSRLAAYRLRRAMRTILEAEGIAPADLDQSVEDVYAAALGT